jgi:diguanylate cyclase (GGDEF)-like protein
MKTTATKENTAKLSSVAILAFSLSLTLCAILVSVTIINRENVERLQIEQLILEKSFRINEVISKLLQKTDSLAMMVIQSGGSTDNFDHVARSLVDDPSILNVLIAPNGVVSKVYPMEGNEAVMGLNFFDESTGNKEAIAAIEAGTLMLGGPFQSAQGQTILVGRLPVYLDTDEETHTFWGLVSVTLKFPQALDSTGLSIFRNQRFAYELWRINPDTDNKQVIASDYEYAKQNARFIEKQISASNADWHLKVWPIRTWYSYPENWALIIASLLISFLVAFIIQNNVNLQRMRVILEEMAKCDPLTGIYNRRHFMETSQIDIERASRLKEDCYVIIYDLDKFKNVNDVHGHVIGDKVLIDTALRVKTTVRPYDLFARYGGEEFILYVSGIHKDDIILLTERLRRSICDKPLEYQGVTINASASFGVAHVDEYDINKAILHADQALYVAKKEGRNRVAFWK